MIPNDFIQTLLSRVDIVEVIDRLVPLKKAGANYVACCPFHSEKSPSFTVSPAKQFYHCFGCGAHGTAIGFLMEYAGKTFPDAVDDLARDAGLSVPRVERPGEHERREEVADLTEHLLTAAKFYRAALRDAPRAIDYLKARGLTGAVAARYGIGYAPDEWQSLARAFPDYGDAALEAAGLVIKGDGGKRYDRFRDRIMFPIHDARGRVVGFGGRVLDRGEPKYLNSPETPVFSKGRELYGLFQARDAIRDAARVVVVEGYMDVVALAQHGVGYAVATLGTSTTPVHVQKLFRLTDGARWRTRCRRSRTARTRSSCSCPMARIRTTSSASAARLRSNLRWAVRCRCRTSCCVSWPRATRPRAPRGARRWSPHRSPTSPRSPPPCSPHCCAGAWPSSPACRKQSSSSCCGPRPARSPTAAHRGPIAAAHRAARPGARRRWPAS